MGCGSSVSATTTENNNAPTKEELPNVKVEASEEVHAAKKVNSE